ncbi:ammonium transporter [bacterium]|nr:MAG: ammonium transporter [bacterium]
MHPKIVPGDTAWLLFSAALMMIMTPALGFFYGGLVRRKNVLSTIMHSFLILCLISVQWVLWGYSLAFGPDVRGWGIIGDLSWAGLNGVGLAPNPAYGATVPQLAFVAFQMMFAVITPALITGAFAERKRFKAFVIFTLLWATFVYDPLTHWVWGHGGWLSRLGTLDFAGGTVVEIASGISALVAAIVLGRRIEFQRGEGYPEDPYNAAMTMLGAGLLWFGWFGFNAGSAIVSGGLAANAFVVTNTAGAMAALTWMTVSWMHRGTPSVVGATIGAIAGLVAITPAAGYVTMPASVLIGMGAGIACYLCVHFMKRSGVDDVLDVFAIHGIGGLWGTLATGIFATLAINPGAANGLLYGNPRQLLIQAFAAAVAFVYCGLMTFVILKVVNAFVPLRVSEQEEVMGLDATQHREVVAGAP